MSTAFNCCECGRAIPLPRSVKTVSCARCGDVYLCNDGAPPRRMYLSLHMLPLDAPSPSDIPADYPPSRWMQPHTRPIRPGLYECKFRHTGEAVFVLEWTGYYFMHFGPRVDCTQLLTWRGVLA